MSAEPREDNQVPPRTVNPAEPSNRSTAPDYDRTKFILRRDLIASWHCSWREADRIAARKGIARYRCGTARNAMIMYLREEMEAIQQTTGPGQPM